MNRISIYILFGIIFQLSTAILNNNNYINLNDTMNNTDIIYSPFNTTNSGYYNQTGQLFGSYPLNYIPPIYVVNILSFSNKI